MDNSQFFYCPYCMHKTICPLINEQMRVLDSSDYGNSYSDDCFYEDYNNFSISNDDNYDLDDNNCEECEFNSDSRAPQQEVNRILMMLRIQQPALFTEMQRYGINQVITNLYFRTAINYTLDNASKYSGNINQKASQIYAAFRRSNPQIFITLRSTGMPNNTVNRIFTSVIEFTLRNMRPPVPVPPPVGRWSRWEDLNGILTSSPGVSSWAPNRLDVFGAGTDNALYHKWWDGSRWSNWESLGGVLTSAPGAVSWGPNRIDVFVRGQNNHMYHKWWDGTRWSDYEDLGGILTSAPAAASWAPNRLDTFVRGTDNALYHKWWDGSRWSDWENLGGVLTSAPAAVSWGPNRIDVFARGEGNRLYHKWWDGKRWSSYEALSGTIASAPAVSSRRPNRLEVFARNQNNQLITRSWNGSAWSNWQNLDGFINLDPAAVSWGPNRTDVFARGRNNALWHIWKD